MDIRVAISKDRSILDDIDEMLFKLTLEIHDRVKKALFIEEQQAGDCEQTR